MDNFVRDSVELFTMNWTMVKHACDREIEDDEGRGSRVLKPTEMSGHIDASPRALDKMKMQMTQGGHKGSPPTT
ncbi:hypothetical protein, partial [Corallococcus sp. AB049A]|uniref:hypothetical protein n=1 Tax=Corallococcus sp. AB049A TaxID=2316721 RepID=UPI001F2835AA